jgi:lambda family phage minor tail protein L
MTDNIPQYVEDLRSEAPAYFEELQKLEPSAVIDLFEIRLTKRINNVKETLRYHAGTNELTAPIEFNGNTYVAAPVEVSGFESSAKGTIARPTLKVANANGAISSLIVQQNYNPLKAEVVRIRTFKKFLDAANFSGGNATADPDAKTEEIWYIDRVSSENLQFVEFELTAKLDMANLELPRRKVTEFCPWKYRGKRCTYDGNRYYRVDDVEISKEEMEGLAAINGLTFDEAVNKFDNCGKRVSSCRLRFPDNEGDNNIALPFGGFLGARVQA